MGQGVSGSFSTSLSIDIQVQPVLGALGFRVDKFCLWVPGMLNCKMGMTTVLALLVK